MMRLGVLVSGRGTNLQAILDGCSDHSIPAEVAIVISNREGVQALDRARAAGVPAEVISHRNYGKWPQSRSAYERDVVSSLQEYGVHLVVCAGYDRLLGEVLLGAFPQRVINIHPALLPSFPGLRAQRDALAHGVKISGATVFFVDDTVDGGPIIVQEAVPVEEDDDESTLSARILGVEHRILPRAISHIARKEVEIVGRKVRLLRKFGG